ncbi:GNAT family N-acetyltransferase [Azospirillum canadense]|uniref:GNAT family N-acetyltransferase n=1 Tax=Azospirillum canadense TaxID=403962 RepID=UPI002225D96F|nr:GNAT family N-acetyltransferase [Azospirillum canadense]MCW2240902.1 hypothetical protein [Azospirillum canadense]
MLAATCLDPGDRLRRLALPGQRPDAPLFMRERTARHGVLSVRTLASLTTCYSTRYVVTGVAEDDLATEVRALRRERSRPHRLLFEALHSLDEVATLQAGLRRGGMVVESFRNFGNWHELIDEGFETYWAARDSRLRNTVERRERSLRRGPGYDLRVWARPEGTGEAITAYQAVYGASWKEPEPYPDFIPALISALLTHGAGLVGALSIAGRPAAAQIWLVGGGGATLFKLAHDERQKQHSPGSVLTKLMLERILSDPAVREIDLGRGDDPYKRQWAAHRRQTWGVAAYDPATLAGMALAATNLLPHVVRRS